MKRGTIEPHKMFKLYKGLYDQRASGWLHLNHRSGARKIYIDHGYPALALSVVANEKLFPRLIREGICSSSETAILEQKAVESEALIEEILLKESVVSEARLRQVLVDLTSESVWRSLSWRDGEFGWVAGEDQAAYMTSVDIITLLGMAGYLVLSELEKNGVWEQVSQQTLQVSVPDESSKEAFIELVGAERFILLSNGARLSQLGLDQTGSQDHSLTRVKDVICGLLLSGFFSLNKTDALSVDAPQVAQTQSPIMKKQVEINKRSTVHKPRASITPPPRFVDDRAMVTPSIQRQSTGSFTAVSESQAPAAFTSDQTIERGVQRDRRIVKPPENWRKFSIGKKNTSTPKSLVPPVTVPPVTAPPVTAPPVTAPPVTAPPVTAPPVTAPPVTAPVFKPISPAPAPSVPIPPVPAPPVPMSGGGIKSGNTRQTSIKQKKQAPEKIQAKVEHFLSVYEKCKSLNHYELLDVEPNVESETLKRVFKKLVGELHIDRFLRFDFNDETLETLKQLFIEYNKAYQVLSSTERRQEYDLEISLSHTTGIEMGGHGKPLSQKRDIAQLLQAEQLTKEAINFVKLGKLDLAEEKVEASLVINIDDPLAESVKIYIDGVKAKTRGSSIAVLRQFIDRLEALTVLYDSREEPFLYLGILYGYCEEYKRGMKAIERALELNPHFGEASSQRRHLQRLEQSTGAAKPSRKGGFFKRR